MRALADGDASLLHGFEKRRLRLRRCAVHLVGEQDIGEDRSRLKFEKLLAEGIFLDNVGAGDVRRHEVGRELDSRKLQAHHIAQSRNQLGLAQTGHSLQQDVAAGEQTHDYAVDDFAVTDDDLSNFIPDAPELFLERFYLLIDGRAHY